MVLVEPSPWQRRSPATPSGNTPPPALQAKVIAVAAAMAPLVKRDHHPDQGWAFVSIDDYYSAAGKALLEAGVSWLCIEEECAGTNGPLRWKFRFDVYDGDGNYWSEAGRVTVAHEYEGPQTTGKVVSYAEKIFLRALLKLVTGEPDADVSKTGPRAIKPGATNIVTPGNNSSKQDEISYEELEKLIAEATSAQDLDGIILLNKRKIANARKNDPDVYDKLAAARGRKLAEFMTDE